MNAFGPRCQINTAAAKTRVGYITVVGKCWKNHYPYLSSSIMIKLCKTITSLYGKLDALKTITSRGRGASSSKMTNDVTKNSSLFLMILSEEKK